MESTVWNPLRSWTCTWQEDGAYSGRIAALFSVPLPVVGKLDCIKSLAGTPKALASPLHSRGCIPDASSGAETLQTCISIFGS